MHYQSGQNAPVQVFSVEEGEEDGDDCAGENTVEARRPGEAGRQVLLPAFHMAFLGILCETLY